MVTKGKIQTSYKNIKYILEQYNLLKEEVILEIDPTCITMTTKEKQISVVTKITKFNESEIHKLRK